MPPRTALLLVVSTSYLFSCLFATYQKIPKAHGGELPSKHDFVARNTQSHDIYCIFLSLVLAITIMPT